MIRAWVREGRPSVLRQLRETVRFVPESAAGPAIVTNPAEIMAAIRQFLGPIQPPIRHSRSWLNLLGLRVRPTCFDLFSVLGRVPRNTS